MRLTHIALLLGASCSCAAKNDDAPAVDPPNAGKATEVAAGHVRSPDALLSYPGRALGRIRSPWAHLAKRIEVG